MHTWKAHIKINGPGYTRYAAIRFPVPDELLLQIRAAVKEGRPLSGCDFHAELVRMAAAKVILKKYAPHWERWERQLYGDPLDAVCIDRITMDDPGDRKRLADAVRGMQFPEWAGSAQTVEVFEDEYCSERYTVTLDLHGEGVVTDVPSVEAEGLEGESAGSSDFAPCYPDYKWITEELMKEYDRQNA